MTADSHFAWRPPAWLTAPVLAVAIPHSVFGRGFDTDRSTTPRQEHAPPEAGPETFGFGESEAEPQPKSTAAPAASVEPPPTETAALPTPERSEPATETAEKPAEPSLAAESEPEREPPPPAPSEAEDLAAPAPPSPEPVPPPDAAAPPDLAPPVVAEPAPGTAVAALPASSEEAGELGVPVADVPALVEPEPGDESESTELAERATMRNRRLYRRVSIEAALEIDGTPARLVDLSMGGFAAANMPQRDADTVVPVMLRMSIDGVDISSRMRARIIYGNEPRAGGRFVDLTASQTAFLRYIVTWRGQSVGAIGTTSLLDAITGWPDRGHPAEPQRQIEPPAPKRRWWTRWFGWMRPRGGPDTPDNQ